MENYTPNMDPNVAQGNITLEQNGELGGMQDNNMSSNGHEGKNGRNNYGEMVSTLDSGNGEMLMENSVQVPVEQGGKTEQQEEEVRDFLTQMHRKQKHDQDSFELIDNNDGITEMGRKRMRS